MTYLATPNDVIVVFPTCSAPMTGGTIYGNVGTPYGNTATLGYTFENTGNASYGTVANSGQDGTLLSINDTIRKVNGERK